MIDATGWMVVAGLGAYHGLNPAMGWLFAVALGLQEQRAAAVIRALLPIAAGHALSVAAVVAALGWVSIIVPAAVLRIVGALVLLGFAMVLFVRRVRHRRIGMRVGARELLLWSFVMASAHGSGLMLLPVLVTGAHAHAHNTMQTGLLVLAIHSSAMLFALATAALVSYHVLGIGFLRRLWVNLDLVWIGALVIAAAATAWRDHGAFSSRCSQTRAAAQLRAAVRGETPSTPAASSIVRPAKKRSSTSCSSVPSRSSTSCSSRNGFSARTIHRQRLRIRRSRICACVRTGRRTPKRSRDVRSPSASRPAEAATGASRCNAGSSPRRSSPPIGCARPKRN